MPDRLHKLGEISSAWESMSAVESKQSATLLPEQRQLLAGNP
jgi:hypothetical protein